MENERNIERYAGGHWPPLRFHDCRRFLTDNAILI